MNIEDKIVNLFRTAILDNDTEISFYAKYEDKEQVCMIKFLDNVLKIYTKQVTDKCLVLSDKRKKAYPKLAKKLADYNTLIGNYELCEEPNKVEGFTYEYQKIIHELYINSTWYDNLFFGKLWTVKPISISYFYIQINNVQYNIKYADYERLFIEAADIEKNKMQNFVDGLNLELKPLNTEYKLNSILDKINDCGYESLTNDDIEFLKKIN